MKRCLIITGGKLDLSFAGSFLGQETFDKVIAVDAGLEAVKALGLEPVGERKAAADGSFIIVYLGDGKTDFRLELTWLRDHPQKYDLGECEFHLALRAEDYEAAHAKHAAWAASALRILPWGSIL